MPGPQRWPFSSPRRLLSRLRPLRVGGDSLAPLTELAMPIEPPRPPEAQKADQPAVKKQGRPGR